MTDPRWADSIAGRWYRNPNRHEGELVYRGVTSITSALPKEALPRWYARTVAEWAVHNKEAWTGLPDEDAVYLLKKRPELDRDRAATRGTTLHGVMERMLAGADYSVEAEVEPWIAALRAMIDQTLPEVEWTERSLFNEKHLHAGSGDLVARFRGLPEFGNDRVFCGLKTSKDVYPDMGVQVVGGYSLGGDYWLDDAGKEHEWEPCTRCALIHLTADGYKIREVPNDYIFRRAFLGALEIRKWQQDGPKIGDPLVAIAPDEDGVSVREVESEPSPPANGDVAPTPSDEEPTHTDTWNREYLRARVKKLDHDRALAMSGHLVELGLPVKLSQMSDQQVAHAIALLGLYEISTPVVRANRPMP